MCFYVQNKASSKAVAERFNANFNLPQCYQPKEEISAFANEELPVILNSSSNVILHAHWGLLPTWAREIEFDKNTKNARVETLTEKPSFREVVSQRCIIPATGFYEWKWHDSKGKQKEKFLIQSSSTEIIGFAGLYNRWKNPKSGADLLTFTIITTEAEGIMKEIHNTKQRMPIILDPKFENDWMQGGEIQYLTDFTAKSLTPMNLKFDF
jgi:putative SOS response-associated peptidase YedK